MEFTTLFLNDTPYTEEEFSLGHKRIDDKIKYVVSGQTVQLNELGALINGYFVSGVGNDIITAELNTVKYVYISFDVSTKIASLLISTDPVVSSGTVIQKLVMKIMYNPIGTECFVRDFSQNVIEVKGTVLSTDWATSSGNFFVNVPCNVYENSDFVPEFFPDYTGLTTLEEIQIINDLCNSIIVIRVDDDGYLYLSGSGTAPQFTINFKVREVLKWQ